MGGVKKLFESNPLKEFMQQHWKSNHVGWLCDQYGYWIQLGKPYKLYLKGEFLIETHSLEAAKEISLVLINDRIMHA